MKNCLYDKALHATKEECGCKPPFYRLDSLGELDVCMGEKLKCAFKIFDDLVKYHNRPIGSAVVCRAPCNDQVRYSPIISFIN